LGIAAVGSGQEPPDALKVFPLKFTSAEEVGNVLTSVIGGERLRFGIDSRTNSIVVYAPQDVLVRVEELVTALDRASPDGQSRPDDAGEYRMFPLKNVSANPDLTALLQNVLRRVQVSFAVDPNRNMVIARGTPEELLALEAILVKLDEAQDAAEEASSRQVRLVWLVSSGLAEDLQMPPDDLQNVVRELEKHGIGELRVAAQLFVNVHSAAANLARSPGSRQQPLEQRSVFQATGTAMLNEPCELSVSGMFIEERAGRTSLEIMVKAVAAMEAPQSDRGGFGGQRGFGSLPGRSIGNLQTMVSAPVGHAVVLGSTPIGKHSSVFVIQILPGIGEQ
jgi:hypothetical protein